MFRTILFGAVAVAALIFVNPSSADAHWRRGWRRGYYGPGYYGYYAPVRVYRPRVYYRTWGYSPGYYYGYPGAYYGYPGYYGYGPGFGVATPYWGFYVR